MSDHYQAMVDLRSSVQNAPRDRLVACVLELLDDADVNTSAHLLAVIMRNVEKPRPGAMSLTDATSKIKTEYGDAIELLGKL